MSYSIVAGAAVFCALIKRTVDIKSIERQCINGLVIIIVGTIMNFKPHQNRFVIVQRVACSKTDLRVNKRRDGVGCTSRTMYRTD